MAHHDAAPDRRLLLDQGGQEWVADHLPGVIERMDTTFPNWWATLAGPTLAGLGALTGRRGLTAAGALRAGSRRRSWPTSPAARSSPAPTTTRRPSRRSSPFQSASRSGRIVGVRLLLVSLGAEEVCQGGIYGFGERHFPALDRERTWFLNVETVGSPHLVLMEGEGTVVMEDYYDRPFRDLIAREAERSGIPMRRGMRWRNSTDAVIPSRAGYPIATIASMNRFKAMSNYHLMTDTAENVDYGTVAEATALTEAVARALAAATVTKVL